MLSFQRNLQNAFSLSAIKAILFARKRKITESNGSVNEGPMGVNNHSMKAPRFLNWCQTQYAL